VWIKGETMENIFDKKFEGIKSEKIDGHISIKADAPTYRTIKDAAGNIIDYQDIKIEGYANTFEVDRGGEQVIPGAFSEKLEEFLENPVLQINHDRDIGSNAGQVMTAYEDSYGLKITALISNSPSEAMRDLRFKIVEGSIRTFSIGGIFYGKTIGVGEDSKIILYKIELREISIVTIPMNKKSLFEVKHDHNSSNQILKSSASENTIVDQSKCDCDFVLNILIDGKKHKIVEDKKDGLNIRTSA
jgi:HK97 family phage prohead protease